MEASTSGTAPGRTVDLAPLQEYRFELEHKSSTITLTLLSGSAEVCGWELRLGVSYHFSTCLRAALFTFTGCTLKVYPQNLAASTADSGSGDEPEGFTDYTANEAPVPSYLELHLALERQRVLADYNAPDDKPSPRVLIVGEKESGKTTLAKTLVNWTVRSGRARSDNGPNADDEGEGQSRGCLFVNLDPSMVRPLAYALLTGTKNPHRAVSVSLPPLQ